MARQEISQRFAGQRVFQFISAGCLVVGLLPYRQSCLRSAPAMAAEIGCALQVFGGCPHTRPRAVVQSSQSGQAAKQRCLTRRSSGRTTALRSGRQALGLRPILRLPSSPQCRCAPLSSNVRRHKRPSSTSTLEQPTLATLGCCWRKGQKTLRTVVREGMQGMSGLDVRSL